MASEASSRSRPRARATRRQSIATAIAPDWSGRVVTTLVVPAEAPTEVRSLEDTTWEARLLFNGAHHDLSCDSRRSLDLQGWPNRSHVPREHRHTDAHRLNPDAVDQHDAHDRPDAAAAGQEKGARLQTGPSPADGDRVTRDDLRAGVRRDHLSLANPVSDQVSANRRRSQPLW